MKDKVITGMSGAEFGVRCWLNAYDLATGKRVWRAYSMGPDEDMLMDPAKTTSMLQPDWQRLFAENLERVTSGRSVVVLPGVGGHMIKSVTLFTTVPVTHRLGTL